MAGMMIGGPRPGASGYPYARGRNLGNLSGAPTPNEILAQRERSRPTFETDPLGNVYGWNEEAGAWANRGNVNRDRAMSALATQTRASTAAPAPARRQASAPNYGDIDRMIRELQGGSDPTITATHVAGAPYDYGEYAKAKERTGLTAQAAMRGLRGQLQRRGIGGSGIDAEMTGDVFQGGVSEIADTDRRLASDAAGRAFQADTQNAANDQQAAFQTAQLRQQRMEMLSQLIRQRYSMQSDYEDRATAY